MPKGSKVGALDSAAQYLKNKLPQTGFFSTLDELVASAPFERAPIEQWRNYLQPGRTFEREGVRFPLKKEELDYSGLRNTYPEWEETKRPVTRDELREYIQKARPEFSLTVGTDSGNLPARLQPDRELKDANPETRKFGPEMAQSEYRNYAFPSNDYEESMLTSPDFKKFDTHFGPDVLSHSRSTIQETLNDKLMRLVEEIQSDRHQAAAQRLPPSLDSFVHDDNPVGPRQGYRSPEEQETVDTWWSTHRPGDYTPQIDQQYRALNRKPPDAPFKDAADYGLFELKNQLLNASKEGQDYLGIVRGQDISRRFSHNPEEAAGTSHIYDKVYQAQLDKLARQYGIPVESVPTKVGKSVDFSTDTMRELESESIDDLMDYVDDHLTQNTNGVVSLTQAAHGLWPLRDVTDELEAYDPDRADTTRRMVREMQRLVRQGRSGEEEFADYWEKVRSNLNQMHQMHVAEIRAEDPTTPVKTRPVVDFRALALSPEIREKILRVGIPIWSLGATGAIGSLMQDGESDEPVNGYAEGGKVKSVIDALSRFKLSKDKADFHREAGGSKATLDSLLEALRKRADLTPEQRAQQVKDQTNRAWEQNTPNDPEFAEGGFIERLGSLARKFGFGEHGMDPEAQDNRARIVAGLMSQLAGATKEGAGGPSGGIGTDEDNIFVINPNTGDVHIGWRPGMVDEVMSLPTLMDLWGDSDQVPDWAREAQSRADRSHAGVRARLGLKDPRGFEQNMWESLGTMAGQIPVPATKAREAAGPLAREARELARTAGSSPIEFLLPTIEPKLENYLSGALAGGALGSLGSPDEKSLKDLVAEQPVAKAEGGSVKASVKPLRAMLEDLRARFDDLTPGVQLVGPADRLNSLFEGLKMAKGGKVSMAEKLIARMKELGLDWEHPSLYKENGDLDVAKARTMIEPESANVPKTPADVLSLKAAQMGDHSQLFNLLKTDPLTYRKKLDAMDNDQLHSFQQWLEGMAEQNNEMDSWAGALNPDAKLPPPKQPGPYRQAFDNLFDYLADERGIFFGDDQ